jgi:hypothetical protein
MWGQGIMLTTERSRTLLQPPPDHGLTPAQERALLELGASKAMVRPAVAGPDVFVYLEGEQGTARFQVAPNGAVVGELRLRRRPNGA